MYSLWVFAFHSYSFSITKTLTIEFCYLLFITANYYAISYFSIPQFLQKKRYLLFVFVTILITAISAFLRSLVAVQLNLFFFKPSKVLEFNTLFVTSFFYILFWVLLITIGKMLIERMQHQQKLELLEIAKTNNELDFLKAQINPHSLFNSLNTIYGHIDRNNQTARATLLQFSELLRYQLYDCNVEKIALEKEVSYIKNYVAFHQLRKDANLKVVLAFAIDDFEFKIAPLLLVVLVENAFKFVSNSADQENKIHIQFESIAGVLNFTVRNTFDTPIGYLDESKSKGIGIINLKRRLELLYFSHYKFNMCTIDRGYVANLTIDML
jgi:LytS/YehU family sensor histidine kinase